jgi:hypothetical protein
MPTFVSADEPSACSQYPMEEMRRVEDLQKEDLHGLDKVVQGGHMSFKSMGTTQMIMGQYSVSNRTVFIGR